MRHPLTRWSLVSLLSAAAAACSTPIVDPPPDGRPPDPPIDAAPSALELSPGSYDFGSVTVDQVGEPTRFTLTNHGEGATGTIAIAITGAQGGDFGHAAPACDQLAPGATCQITVVFQPTADGSRLATLDVTAEQGGHATALLEGTGEPVDAALSIDPVLLDVGPVALGSEGAWWNLTVTNDGNLTSGTLSIALDNNLDGFQLDSRPGDCSVDTTLAPGASCLVHVRLVPNSTGEKSAQLVVSASPGDVASAALVGSGEQPGPAQLVLDADGAFGTVPVGQTSVPHLFTVTNQGDSTSSTMTVLSSSPRFAIGSDNCSNRALLPGGDCTFTVGYTPVIAGGAGGQDDDLATVTVAASSGGPVVAELSGTGTAELSVAIAAAGAPGRVQSDPAGIDCTTGTCTASFVTNTVTLTAVPGSGSGFAGWGGACTGEVTPTCTVTMDAARSVTAGFVPLRRLTVVAAGGTVTSSPGGIDCPGTCAADFNQGTLVTLTATPAAGHRFGSWSQAGCTGPTCAVTMDGAHTVTATFVRQYTLTVLAADLGIASSSLVTIASSQGPTATCASSPGAGTTCQLAYDAGVDLVLSRTLGADTAFAGWSGDCAGTGGCGPLTMNQDHAVEARFAAYRVVITIAGAGKVAIAPTTSGALCPDDSCTPVFPGGTAVTLTPQAGAGSAFWGWGSGSCSGTGACALTMTGNRTAFAEFRTARTLTVTRSGSGTVTSSPAGISCGTGCSSQSAAFPDGRVVTLSAAPGFGHELGGWTGACASQTSATCTVTMDAARTAGVAFVPGADLVVSALGCSPDPVAPGATLTCSVTVTNQGTAPALASISRLVLSTDATITSSDPQLATCAVPQLAAGASSIATCSGALAAATAPGAYHAGIVADAGGAVAEVSETNNTAADPVTVARPDVTVTALGCTPDPAAPGATISCAVTLADAGPAVGALAYQLRLSSDDVITTADPLLATCTVAGGIAAGGSVSTTCSATLPAALGPRHVGVIADPAGAIAEADETNNTLATPIRIGTDLSVSDLTCEPARAPGSDATCTYTIDNAGTAIGPFTTEVRLSTNATLTSNDPLLGTCSSSGQAAGASVQQTCRVTIPAGQAPGIYTIGVLVDAPDVWPEWDYSTGTNNTAGRPLVVTNPSGIDLQAAAPACEPSWVAPGAPMTCAVTVTNLGPVAAGGFTIMLRHSSSSVGSSSPALGSCDVAGLAGGATTTVTCAGTAPGSSGTRRLSAWLDSQGVVAETDEANNESPEITFRIAGSTPDLVVDGMACPDQVVPGATITCDVTIFNRGTGDAAPFANRIVRSNDTTISTSDAPGADCLASAGLGGLETITLPCTLTLTGVGASAPYIGIVLDTGTNVSESSETNNTGYDRIRVVPSGIDLDPGSLACTATRLAQGAPVMCRARVDNDGTVAAPASLARLRLGTTVIADCPTPAVPALGSAWVECLATIPIGTVPGNVSLELGVDDDAHVTETSESNNTTRQTVSVVLAAIDLVADNITCSSVGSAASCWVQAGNTGGVPAGPFRMSLRQSSNSTVDGGDPEVGSCTAPGLAAGGTLVARCDFVLTGSSGYLGVIVDADDDVTESLETNNLVSTSATWNLPNLDITAMSCSYNGGEGKVYCNITIITPLVVAGPFDLTIRRSSDTSYGTGDTLVATVTLPGLAAGSPLIVPVSGPSVHSGYMVARVDDGSTVPETSESDNTAYDAW